MSWWKKIYNLDCDRGYRNYPHNGQVLGHYRVRCGYTLARTGNELEEDAAESTVKHWEKNGLDKISSLRALAVLFDIPWELLGLDAVEPRADELRSVVSEYRVKRGWTSAELATALTLLKGSVYLMETKNISLDSLERRRTLQFLLKIPPALLGLDALHLLEPSRMASGMLFPDVPDLAAIRVVQEGLLAGHFAGPGEINQVALATGALSQVKAALPGVSSAERSAWLEQQSLLYQGLALVLRGSGQSQATKALAYAKQSVTVARRAENAELLSSALLRQMSTMQKLSEDKEAAKLAKDFPFASQLAHSQGVVLARVLALDVADQVDRSQVLSLLDKQKWSIGEAADRPYRWGFNPLITACESAEALHNLTVHGPRDALHLLKQAEALLERVNGDITSLNRGALCWFKVVQSRVRLAQGRYEEAIASALEAIPLVQENNRNFLPHLIDVYRALQKSKYAQSKAGEPLVTRLGWLLFREGEI